MNAVNNYTGKTYFKYLDAPAPPNAKGIVVGGGQHVSINANLYENTWIPIHTNSIFLEGHGVAYNNSNSNPLWVAVGDGFFTIAYSTNGIDWNVVETSIFILQIGYDVAYNNSNSNPMWVAVGGEEVPTTLNFNHSIVYSTDGMTWSAVAGSTNILRVGHGIAHNGSVSNPLWVAVGLSSSSTNIYSIATSPDGMNWTLIQQTTFIGLGLDVAFGNNVWVAVGVGALGSAVYYSTNNGLSWTPNNITAFEVSSVAWNGTQFVAANGSFSIYSSNGTSWTNGNSIGFIAAQIAWNNNDH